MMNSKPIRSERPLAPSKLISPLSAAPFRPLRAMHEIKRRILKQLLLRMDKDKPFAA